VVVDVACGDATHRISWRRGKVVLHDHVLRDEEVMLALGGAPPRCVAILQAWRDRAGWERANRPQPPGFIRNRPPPDVPEELAAVRRIATVRAWERRWRRGADPLIVEDLYRVLRARARPPLGAHLEVARRARSGGPVAYVEVRMTERDEQPRVDGRIARDRSYLLAWLSPAWLYLPPPVGDGEFAVDRARVIAWRELARDTWKAELVQPS